MNSLPYKIVFLGTSDFALPGLKKLIESDFVDLKLVITQPDKIKGRKKIITPPPVKILAQKYNLPIIQPKKIIEAEEKIKAINPEAIILISYGQIIPPEILKIPSKGCLNLHPSLLPKYRGASPIQYTILNGEKETGVTLILMDEKIDHGPIIGYKKIRINPQKEDFPFLKEKLANLGAKLLEEILLPYLKGKIESRPQDDKQATFTKILKRDDGKIDWQKPAEQIERQIRAFRPWPGSFTFWRNKMIKILEAKVIEEENHYPPGKIFLTKNKKMAVQCSQKSLLIEKIQKEGSKIMDGQSFINGHQEIINDSFS